MLVPSLDQRVAVRHHLKALSPEDAANYIRHRLRISGLAEMPFSDDAVRAICIQTGGVPRRINNVCDLALMESVRQNVAHIGSELIRSLL